MDELASSVVCNKCLHTRGASMMPLLKAILSSDLR